MSNFINIVAGGTCWTCLLSPLQMVGNVPDLLTSLGASAAGLPQPLQPIPLTPLCVCVCVRERICFYVYLCIYIATWSPEFPESLACFQLCHTHKPLRVSADSAAASHSQKKKAFGSSSVPIFLIYYWEQISLVRVIQKRSLLCLLRRVEKSQCHIV